MPKSLTKPTAKDWLEAHVNYDGPECLTWPYSTQPTGYGAFGFTANGKKGMYYAHRYMCELVNGPAPSPIHEAAHSCGRGKFSCVDPRHLSWKTPSENAKDSAGHGTSFRNRWGNKGRITRGQVAEIWALKGRETQAVISAKFGISQSTVRDIYLGRTHLGMTAVAMLRQLSERDLGQMKNYSSGLWSRQSLEAMIDDLVADSNSDDGLTIP